MKICFATVCHGDPPPPTSAATTLSFILIKYTFKKYTLEPFATGSILHHNGWKKTWTAGDVGSLCCEGKINMNLGLTSMPKGKKGSSSKSLVYYHLPKFEERGVNELMITPL